jgi:hypothetical protein
MARGRPMVRHPDWRTYQSRIVRGQCERLWGTPVATYHFQFRWDGDEWIHRVIVDAGGRQVIGCTTCVTEDFVRSQRRKVK